MSAFRDDLEQLQEKLRRSDDEIRELRARAESLSAKLRMERRTGAWVSALVLIALVAAGAGFGAGTVDKRRAQALAEASRAEQAAVTEQLLKERIACVEEKIACERELGHSLGAKAPATPPNQGPCRCAPGDPLCSCLDSDPSGTQKVFDRSAASAMLSGMGETIARCGPPPSRTIHVRVTFATTGHVSSAQVDSGAESLTRAEMDCVVAELRKGAVPPFDGRDVVVGKTYAIGGRPSLAPMLRQGITVDTVE